MDMKHEIEGVKIEDKVKQDDFENIKKKSEKEIKQKIDSGELKMSDI